MLPERQETYPETLDGYLEAFEKARASQETVDLAEFLPAPSHPLRGPVLRELVRIDLELGWEQGRPRPLPAYRTLFPELFADPDGLGEVAFEEYRLRLQAGERPAPQEYAREFGIDTSAWPGLESPDRIENNPPSLRQCLERGSGPGPRPQRKGGLPPRDPSSDAGDLEPEVAYLFHQALTTLPEVGTRFAGFHLEAVLGQGSFARVYLARQGDLANRRVVLKMSVDLLGEPQTLGQLQHTNIVPIYSVHQAGPFHAVCMPYFGGTTLADVLRDLGQKPLPESGKALGETVRRRCPPVAPGSQDQGEPKAVNGVSPPSKPSRTSVALSSSGSVATLHKLEALSYVEAVLWIGEQLAEGLAHAHERGILHRDLKPANILLTDEGRPMLLDFNLSADIKGKPEPEGTRLGGTLPYLSPEHLGAFQGEAGAVDARGDLFSLGVILFELLTGRLPFPNPTGPFLPALARMRADRRQGPPRLRRWNRGVSPAAQAIVRHCLEPDPRRRYQSAQELREDLRRQLDHRPLGHIPEPSLRERGAKWLRRHPRLTSPGFLGVLLALVLGLAAIPLAWHLWEENQESQENLARTASRLREAQENEQQAEAGRAEAEIRSREAEQEKKLVQQARQQFDKFLARAVELGGMEDHLNLLLQGETGAAEPPDLEKDVAECRQVLEPYQVLVNPQWQELPMVRCLLADSQEQLRKEAANLLYLLARAAQFFPASIRKAAPNANPVHFALELNGRAMACHPSKEIPRAYLIQKANLILQQYPGRKAEAALLRKQAEAIPPRTALDFFRAGSDEAAEGNYRRAAELLRQATERDPQRFGPWLALALCHWHLADYSTAAGCFSTCIALRPDSQLSLYYRGLMYLLQRKYELALEDFDQFIGKRPGLAFAYIQRAMALHKLGRSEAAIADLDQAVKLQPNRIQIYFLRAEIHRESNHPKAAEEDRNLVLTLPLATAEDYTYRAIARGAADLPAALDDLDRALQLAPGYLLALYRRAHVLVRLDRLPEAIRVFDSILQRYPESRDIYGERGLLHARLNFRAKAHEDARACLVGKPTGARYYQAACIHALTSDGPRALQLLSLALQNGYGYDLIGADRDLIPLRTDPDFNRLTLAAWFLKEQASGKSAPK